MVNVSEHSRPSPESKKFDKENFPVGTDILYFDDVSKKWKVGMVDSWEDPVKDGEGKLCGKFWTQDSGIVDLKLSLSPKKIDKIPNSFEIFSINGKNYKRTEVNVLQDSGEIEITLVNTSNANDRLKNINLKTIKNLEAVEKFESDVENEILKLKRDIAIKADSRAKEVLIGLTAVEKKIKDVAGKLGTLSEWQEIGQSEAEQIGQEIKQLQEEIKSKLAELSGKLKGIEKRKDSKDSLSEEALGLQSRLDRDVAKKSKSGLDAHAKKVESAKTLHDAWKKDKDAWDKKKKAKEDWDKLADKKGKADPGDPGVEPKEPPKPDSIKTSELEQAKIDAAWELFDNLKNDPSVSAKHKEIVKKVEDSANKQAKREGFGLYTDYDDETKKQVIAENLQKVLDIEKGAVSVEGEKFDLEAEKGELKTKIKEIMTRAEAVGLPAPVGKTFEQITNEWLKEITDIDPAKTQIEQETDILKQWNLIRFQEVKVYEAEQKKAPKVEKAESEKDFDIPDTILRELFADRSQEVKVAMELIYTEKLKTGEERKNDEAVLEAVKNLMKKAPNEAVLQKLRQYGIKNWDQFKDLWDKKLAKKSVGVLDQWGRADLDSEVAKQVSGWDTFKALKWQIGAQMAVTVGCGIGGAVAISAIFASGGAAGVGLLAAGGAGGIGVRNIIRKMFGKSEWLEARKKKALEEMFENKRKDIVTSTLDKRFGGSDRKNMTAETNAIFSSIMAEAIRTASEDSVKGHGVEMVEEAKALKGDPKRLYIQALENAREAGVEYSVEQKIKFALALKEISGRGEQITLKAVKDSDLSVVKMMEFGLGGLSGKWTDSKDHAVAGWAATLGVGAAVSVAVSSAEYSSVARGVMGGLGGGVLGYKLGESWRQSRETKQAEVAFMPRFNTVSEQMDNYLASPNSLNADSLKKFGEEIKAFNRYLKGESDTKEEQKILDLLKSNPLLYQRTENLVYQANRRGVFARINLAEMQQNAQEIDEKSDIKLADSTKSWLKKKGWQAGSIAVGAMVGAGAAIGLGIGARELKEYFTVPERVDTTRLNAKLAAEDIDNEMKKIPSRVVPLEHVGDMSTPDVVLPIENMPAHPAGLIDAPTKASDFSDWRHQIMEKMGYKFHGGKIDHALRFHPGAKIALMHADGTPVMDKSGQAVDYTFKKGGSTWDAMDHLKSKTNGLLKAGEVPTIKIEGADTGKVEVLDKYQVESHAGGKTQMKSGVEVVKGKELDWTGEKVKGVPDVPKNNFDLSTVGPDKSGTFTALDGEIYQQVPGGAGGDYYVRDNHLYTFEGKYIGEQYVQAGQGKTSWSTGGAVEGHSALESMLKGTPAGGPAEAGTPQVGGGKAGDVETVRTVDAKVGAPVAEDKVAGATAEQPVEMAPVPAKFVGHEDQYQVLQNMKNDVAESMREGLMETNVSNDNSKVLPKLMESIERALAKSPKLMDGEIIKDALDPKSNRSLDDRLFRLVAELDTSHNIKLTTEERILLGSGFVKGEDFVTFEITRNGEVVNALVATDGSHAIVYENVDSGEREFVTDSKQKFDQDNLGVKSRKKE